MNRTSIWNESSMDRTCCNCRRYVDLVEFYPEYEYDGECAYRLGPTNRDSNGDNTCTDFKAKWTSYVALYLDNV